MEHIKSLKSRDYWQKFPAGEDWFEKDFQYVVKHVLQQKATFRRKQWERTTVLLNLLNHGMLDGNKVGAAFGAGRENLLFLISQYTQHLHATDLYNLSTVWKTANFGQYQSPEEFVKAAAPPDCDTSNLSVHDMDMRDLSHFDDDSLDFCYSCCAFEHIGDRDDFISHLKEVGRVLKPGGIYSMTTEFLFNATTKTLKHNYKFDLEYLRQLFIDSGLDTAPHFDGSCQDNLINWPKPVVSSLSVKNITNQIPTPILYMEGIPFSTSNFVLSPSQSEAPKTFQAMGMEQTAKLMTERSKENIVRLFKTWQLLDPYNRLRREVSNYLEDHREYLIDSGFELNLKDQLVGGYLVYTDFIHLDDLPSSYKVQYDMQGYEGQIIWQVIEKDPMRTEGRRSILNHTTNEHNNQGFKLDFQPLSEKVYALAARLTPKEDNAQIKINDLMVWLKAHI